MAKKAALAIRSGLFSRYTTLGSLVMVSSGTVDVTVVQLFGGGVAHCEHFDGKVQSFAGERVVGVQGDAFAIDGDHGDDLVPFVVLSFELHADFDLDVVVELVAGYGLDPIVIPFSIALVGRHIDFDFVALAAAFERSLEPRYELAGAVDIGQGIALFRAVDKLALVVDHLVVQQDDFLLRDLHNTLHVKGLPKFSGARCRGQALPKTGRA